MKEETRPNMLDTPFYIQIQIILSVVTKNITMHITQYTMILSFRTDMPGQTVQTQEQSDQGLSFRLHGLDSILYVRAI